MALFRSESVDYKRGDIFVFPGPCAPFPASRGCCFKPQLWSLMIMPRPLNPDQPGWIYHACVVIICTVALLSYVAILYVE